MPTVPAGRSGALPSTARTGVAYSPSFLAHDAGSQHPERPDRLRSIVSHLQATRLWDQVSVWEPAPIDPQTLDLAHTPVHRQFIEHLVASGGGRIDADTRASVGSWDAALRAAGALLEASAAVYERRLTNAYCIVRPPGHHATPDQAMGFCLFNNVAVAAAWLLAQGKARRIAILDYDVHHGNGTQDIFYDRDDVLYVSTHQVPLYPGTGLARERGQGAGEGYTVNIPLPPGAGDAVYADVLPRIIEPAVRRYRPDVIFVSLGFDAFWRDPLAQLRLSIGNGYAPLIRSACQMASELCEGRLVVALEGGYDLDALAHGSDAVCRLLLGQSPAPDPLGDAPDQLAADRTRSLVDSLIGLHGLA